jgi:hypothetical protein
VLVYDPDENAFQDIVDEKFFRMESIKQAIANADIV